jgi:tRNA-dihydrouridine synthase A
MLTEVDPAWFGAEGFAPTRVDIAERLIGYAASREATDPSTKALIRHVMGLFAGQPGARLWRRSLSEGLSQKLRPSEILRQALTQMHESARAA